MKAGGGGDKIWTACIFDAPMIIRFNSHRELKRRQQREMRSVSPSAPSVEGGAGWRIVMMKKHPIRIYVTLIVSICCSLSVPLLRALGSWELFQRPDIRVYTMIF
jgi:hypothetical protein